MPPRRASRFHGRIDTPQPRRCDHGGCAQPGEFRAPQSNRTPGDLGGWQFLCLDHVRAFNAGYNYFDGLSSDEIFAAQSPIAGWERSPTGSVGREAFSFGHEGSFADPLGLFGGAASGIRPGRGPLRESSRRWAGPGDGAALQVLGLGDSATANDVRRAYKRLVRRYHPDSNEGDRTQEGKLQAVVNAYTHLKQTPVFRSES
ncbi:J domain-containing protein [Sandarakinorhabdus sp.]|uniref:J domain-containing protein n=1 Tax=Sandarakinorhabdus sp. TaxID=1916663 RepID=UPI00286E2B96|nr:J domain-containing protein [Sandarakinorhabdus sp.]